MVWNTSKKDGFIDSSLKQGEVEQLALVTATCTEEEEQEQH